MYYYIKGTLSKKTENFVVVDAGGVGYMMNTSLATLSTLPSLGEDVTMYTYLLVREDAMELCGFATIEEREMFLKLIGVSGVGPKAAMAILSVLTPSSLASAVISNDIKLITRAQGVGPKVAQRVVLELKDKISASELGLAQDIPIAVEEESKTEAIKALMALGYSGDEARKATAKVESGLGVEEVIKKALMFLM